MLKCPPEARMMPGACGTAVNLLQVYLIPPLPPSHPPPPPSPLQPHFVSKALPVAQRKAVEFVKHDLN